MAAAFRPRLLCRTLGTYGQQHRPSTTKFLSKIKRSSIHQCSSLFRRLTPPVKPFEFEDYKRKMKIITDLRESIKSQTDVGLSIAKHLLLSKEVKDKNVVFSSLSIHVLLSLVAAGSKGPTCDQLLSFLRSKSTNQLNSLASNLFTLVLADGSSSGGPCLSFANSVWVDKSLSLKSSFKEVVNTNYKATLASLDFQNKGEEVANEINSWAEKETNGLVKHVVPPGSVDHFTRLILANALYFKGAWYETYDASKTKNYDFHLLNGSSIKVPFMTSKEEQFISVFDSFKVLRLPYKQGGDERQFSMYMFLPDSKDGLSALVDKVCSESVFLESKRPRSRVEVGEFLIPRFKISFGFEIPHVLEELGMVLPSLTCTEMVDSPVYVSNIFLKSVIEVNEQGTEAAAVSAAMMGRCRGMEVPKKIDFVADHPLLFMIREDITGEVLFVGQVLNPLAASY